MLVWFLAAAVGLYQAHRFVILFVAPFGLALAAGAAEAHRRLLHRLQTWMPRHSWTAGVLAGLAAALLIAPPVWRGYAAARGYYPAISRAWWDTLGEIRRASRPDAIVTAWWDYGYWIKYGAERRTSVDGASLLTHAPYWVAKALLAPSEAESTGILRMLACGSDATPLPEGSKGAYGKLVGAGLDEMAAYTVLADLVKLDKAGAERYLAGRGFGAAGQKNILASTHCAPPEVFLIVSEELFYKTGSWLPHGAWDMRKSYMARRSRYLAEGEAVADLMKRFGYGVEEARAWYARARALKPGAELDDFPAPPQYFIPTEWVRCQSGRGPEMVCRMAEADRSAGGDQSAAADTAAGGLSFIYDPAAPERGRLRQGAREGRPAVTLVAGARRLEEHLAAAPEFPGIGVLVDPANRSVLAGAPLVIRSTLLRLSSLGERYAKGYKKFADRSTLLGDRIVAWKVDWSAAGAGGK